MEIGKYETIESSIKYLLDINGTPLILHRRKTFINGFIVCALSTRMLALELSKKNFFSYILTYKFSQDHLELLFACIREINGFNNNPELRTFKSATKRILLRAPIVASNVRGGSIKPHIFITMVHYALITISVLKMIQVAISWSFHALSHYHLTKKQFLAISEDTLSKNDQGRYRARHIIKQ